MKLTITKQEIKSALSTVADVAQRTGTMPVLQNILMRRQNNILTMTASDMEAQVTTSIPSDGEDFGLTIPAAKFKAIIGTLDDSASITLDLKDSKLTVKSGKSRFNLQTLPASEFPLSTTSDKSVSVELDQGVFKSMLAGVAHAMGNRDIRPMLNGVCFTSDFIAASDGARAAICKHDFGGTFNAIIPNKSVHRLIKMLDSGQMIAEIYEEKIRFQIGETELIVKLIDGKFPDVARVFFAPNGEPIKMDKDAFLDCLSRASIQLPHHNGGSLIVENGSLSITCQNQGDESTDEMEVSYDGDRLEFGYNLNYLRDAVSAADGSVSMNVGGNIAGTLLISGEGELRCVVTPMRI